jgi:hypothetical protein
MVYGVGKSYLVQIQVFVKEGSKMSIEQVHESLCDRLMVITEENVQIIDISPMVIEVVDNPEGSIFDK